MATAAIWPLRSLISIRRDWVNGCVSVSEGTMAAQACAAVASMEGFDQTRVTGQFDQKGRTELGLSRPFDEFSSAPCMEIFVFQVLQQAPLACREPCLPAIPCQRQ